MRLKGALEELTLYIYDLQPCNDCAGCDNCDSKILNLTESLKSAGIDTADEFVEKLADQFVCYQFSEFTKRCEVDELRVHIKRIKGAFYV